MADDIIDEDDGKELDSLDPLPESSIRTSGTPLHLRLDIQVIQEENERPDFFIESTDSCQILSCFESTDFELNKNKSGK